MPSKMKFIFVCILLFLVHCSSQTNNPQCDELATLYRDYAERQSVNYAKVHSWKALEQTHLDIINDIVKSWSQESSKISLFSNDFFLFLRTKTYLQCDEFSNMSSTISTEEVATGVTKKVIKTI